MGDRTEVRRAWNSFSDQDSGARKVGNIPPTPPPRLSEDRVCQSPSDTRLTHPSHSRLKPSAWTILMLGKQNALLAKS